MDTLHRALSKVKVHRSPVPAPKQAGRGGPIAYVEPPQSNGFPKIWEYYGCSSAGDPVMTSPGIFDMGLVAKLANHDLVTLNSTPFGSDLVNSHVVSLIKTLNPNCIVLMYDQFINRFAHSVTMYGELWNTVLGPPDRRFYYNGADPTFPNQMYPWGDISGSQFSIWYDINPVIQQVIAVWLKYLQGRGFDGPFYDYFNTPYTANLDYARAPAGYASQQAAKNATNAAAIALATAIKTAGYRQWGNGDCATSAQSFMTGELMEGWENGGFNAPPLNYGSFDLAMARALVWQGPTYNSNGSVLLKAEEAAIGTYDSTTWLRGMRKTLASACIAGGYSYVSNNRNPNELTPLRWADEYWVDAQGVADANATNPRNKGWLGRPLEWGYKDAGGCYARRFEGGIVIVNGTSGSLNFTLEKPYRRILGTHNPTLNDGTIVSGTISVPACDGRFFIRIKG